MQSFCLAQNPFAVLGLSPRGRVEEIEDAYEDALIERPQEEGELLRRKQELLTPNTRLLAELSWFPEIAPSRANHLLAKLAAKDEAGLLLAISELPPLSAANISAE